MIIVKLCGGIGNQMFQYAAARRLAYVNNVPLKLDLGWFGKNRALTERDKRNYNLDCFMLSVEIAEDDEVSGLISHLNNPLSRRLPYFLKKYISHFNKTHIVEKAYNFDPEILMLKDNVYLDGYWQSDKYFNDAEDIIRFDFTFCDEPEGQNLRYAELIRNLNSVSLHVRRGDYVTSAKTGAFHGLCSLDYYKQAVNEIFRQTDKPVFFMFSDDMEWVKTNLKIDADIYYVDCNTLDTCHEDLRLMSLCKHHIIANSSFSWWGAWLSSYTDKIVCAPEKWFNASVDTRDNVPGSWTRL